MSNEIPRDEWIIGEGLEAPGRWYVLHTRAPMFIAEIFDEDEGGWIEGGLSWSLSDGQVAGNVVFYDDPPPPAEIDRLILSLGAILDDYDTRAERRTERLRGQAARDAHR